MNIFSFRLFYYRIFLFLTGFRLILFISRLFLVRFFLRFCLFLVNSFRSFLRNLLSPGFFNHFRFYFLFGLL